MRRNCKLAALAGAVVGLVQLHQTTAHAADLTWLGTASNVWDVGSAANWLNGASAVPFNNGDNTFFTDLSTTNTIDLAATVLPGGATFNNSTVNYTIAGVGKISGTTSLVKNGAATVNIGNSNDYTGGTIINAGTLSTGTAAPPVVGPTLTAFGNGSIQINSGGTLAIAYSVGSSTPISNLLSGTGALVVGTAGGVSQLYIDGSNPNFAGGVQVLDGTDFRVKKSDSLGSGNTGTVSIGAAYFFTEIASDQTFSRPLAFTGAGTLASFASGNATASFTSAIVSPIDVAGNITVRVDQGSLNLSGVVSGAGRLTKTNSGTLILANASNNFTGGVQINGSGRVAASADGNFGAVPAASTANQIGIANSTLLAVDTFTLNANRGITLASSGTFDVAATKTLTIAGAITGTNFTKRGAGSLNLSGSNSFSGTISIGAVSASSGIIRLLSDNALAGASAIAMTGNNTSSLAILELDGGRTINGIPLFTSSRATTTFLRATSGINTFGGDLTINAGGGTNYKIEALANSTLITNGALTTTLAPTTVRNVQVGGAGTVIVNGIVSNGPVSAGSLTVVSIQKTDAGTVSLANLANSYTAGTTVTAGTLNAARIFNNGATTLAAGTTLRLIARPTAGDTAATSLFNGTLSIAGTSTVPTARLDLTNNAAIIDYTGSSNAAAIESLVKVGNAGGLNNGQGVVSSTAAVVPVAAVGVVDSVDLGSPTTFNGAAFDGSATLVRYTLAGDADLSGTVTSTDFNRLVAGYGTTTASATPARWYTGDFNYDGTVDTIDFAKVIASFGVALPAAGPASLPTPGAPVPEPTAAVAVVAGFAFTRRRRG